MHGKLTKTGLVETYLKKNQLASGARVVKISTKEEGKIAKSNFKIVSQTSKASLVKIKLITGRTHQIRVHSAYLGHPIVGDVKYGSRDLDRSLLNRNLNRMYLHGSRLKFNLLIIKTPKS